MCNKVSYKPKREARKDAKQIKFTARNRSNSYTRNKNKKLKPYICPVCQLWHLTSLSKSITRRFKGEEK